MSDGTLVIGGCRRLLDLTKVLRFRSAFVGIMNSLRRCFKGSC